MKHPESKHSEITKAIDSVINLAYGDRQEMERQTAGEVSAALKGLGVETESGWQTVQAMLQTAEGKARLRAARAERVKSQALTTKPAGVLASAEALIDEIKGMLSMSGGQAAVFARKAESMPIKDLESLRDQLIRTAARAAKKPRNEG